MRRQGSIFSAVASFPSTVTLAETRPRSIEPMYRKLSPVRPATSSWVRSRSWRSRLRFFARTCFKSMPRRSWNRNESARNDSSYSLQCPILEEPGMGRTEPSKTRVAATIVGIVLQRDPLRGSHDESDCSTRLRQSNDRNVRIWRAAASPSAEYRVRPRATMRSDPAGRCLDYISAVRARSHRCDRFRRHVRVLPATAPSPSATL